LIVLLHYCCNTVFKRFIQFIEISNYIVNNLIAPAVDFLLVIPNIALSVFVLLNAEAVMNSLNKKLRLQRL